MFEGRVEDLKQLAKSLLGQSGTDVVANQAITGMGGLGKTQLAVEFAHRYGRYFRGVHWLNLADPAQLDAEIARCGLQMAFPNFPTDQPSQVVLTLNTWKANGPRLLVLDNFEAVDQVNNVLPRLRHSNLRLLITSRRSDWTPASGLHALPLDVFSADEVLAFLANALPARKDNEADQKTLADRLGYLPLALELASRYLDGHPRLSIVDYLKQAEAAFEHPSMRDWRKDRPASTGHDLDLQHTFALSWEGVKDETAQKLFQMAGYLAPNTPIPLEIFEKASEISKDSCDEILDVLYGLGLLRQSDENLPTIHPLLAEYARGMDKENQKILESLAVALGTLSKETLDTGLPARFVPIRAHLHFASIFAEEAGLKPASALWSYYGSLLRIIADYRSAQTAYENALRINKLVVGENHQDTATSLNDLGNLFMDQGDYSKAKGYIEQALHVYEKIFGNEHPWVATAVNNLGAVMEGLGYLSAARLAYERALQIDEANFGPDHPKVAIRVNNLGSVLQDLGDLPGARRAYERALQIDEARFGPDHPNVAVRLNNLGMVMNDLGDYPGASHALERALQIDEATFGPEHPKVAVRLNNLGLLRQSQGDLPGARSALERALEIKRKVFPPDHPSIQLTEQNLNSLDVL